MTVTSATRRARCTIAQPTRRVCPTRMMSWTRSTYHLRIARFSAPFTSPPFFPPPCLYPTNSRLTRARRDERSIANRLAAAEKQDSPSPHTITDPLKPAQDHGNEPSRGAQVDAELQAEDELRLKEKGIQH